MKAEELVDTLAETPSHTNTQTFGDTIGNVKAKKSTRTLIAYREGRVQALVVKLAETVSDAKAKKPFDTLGDVKAEALMDTLTDTLAQAEAKTLGDTLGDVVAEGVV